MQLPLLAGLIALVFLLLPGMASAYTMGPDVTSSNPNGEVVWSYTPAGPTQPGACDTYDYPDGPTRVFRDRDARVQLMISHTSFFNNGNQELGGARRLFTSTGFATLTRGEPCSSPQVFLSSRENDPSLYNNHEWLNSQYTIDGQNVYSLVHDEYHGWDTGGQMCPVGPNPFLFLPECWYNSVTLAKSSNKGASYTQTPRDADDFPTHAVATLPNAYRPFNGEAFAAGYFSPSNMVKRSDGYYYALILADGYEQTGGPDQQRGACVMRTNNLSDPSSWRAWGDADLDPATPNSYEVQFINPYKDQDANPKQHACTPVIESEGSYQQTQVMHDSLTWNRYLHKWMLIGPSHDPDDFRRGVKLHYALSDDLITWSKRRLLIDLPFHHQPCDPSDQSTRAVMYPAALDAHSNSQNYETTGQDFYVYLTRFNAPCKSDGTWQYTDNRDLIRIPVHFTRPISAERNATLESELMGGSTGFDFTRSDGGYITRATGAGAYEGNAYASLLSYGTSPGPLGVLNANAPGVPSSTGWGNGTDVWYGAAYNLSTTFSARNDRVMLVRWQNAAYPSMGSRYGGIVLGSDDKYRLVRGNGSTEDVVGPSGGFTLPEGSWFWLEVHQKLESSSASKPVSEVFVNGKLVASSTAPNAYPDSDGKPIRVHFGYAQRNASAAGFTTMLLDRASISLNERGPIGAPATPLGLTGTEQNGLVTVYWNAVPGAIGYRAYKQNADGSWSLRLDGGTAFFDTGLTNCTTYRYRVAAYDIQGRESIVSEPLDLTPSGSNGCP
jgi:hypothetical protein